MKFNTIYNTYLVALEEGKIAKVLGTAALALGAIFGTMKLGGSKEDFEQALERSMIKEPLEMKTMKIPVRFVIPKDPKIMETARVLYAEGGPNISSKERYWMASSMKNRYGDKMFNKGKLKNMHDVVTDKSPVQQYEGWNDPNNENWKKSSDPIKNLRSEKEIQAWNQSVFLAYGKFKPVNTEVTMFHDKSLKKGFSDNKYSTFVPLLKTSNFTFYKAVAK